MTPLQNRIRQRLEDLGLSPVNASLRVGTNPELIRQLLRQKHGTANPRRDTLNKVATALETSVAWLLGEDMTAAAPDAGAPAPALDPDRHLRATRAALAAIEAQNLSLDPTTLSRLIEIFYTATPRPLDAQ
ncbi:helix-turn-helix domain-containing protein [Roseibium aestuarii]|uniref:Helix-turn-helix domain-containing protein n=1 Tax=Roseibium aestuarii TaxID=2600299 RepID=A0ABW4JYS5_9HYPH|nr:helix-turn-helix transcriptional regulator [Roseibium aestuarii]